MADEKRQEYQMIYHTAGKNSFFELFDVLDIGKILATITLYDPTRTEGKVTNKVSFYLNVEDIIALGRAAASGRLDNLLEIPGRFPAVDYGIPKPPAPRMRQWSMAKTDKGMYAVRIIERERKDSWKDTSDNLGEASFFINPFELIAMAAKVELYATAKMAAQAAAPKPDKAVGLGSE